MSRVDFYILTTTGESSRHRFACRLAEKAYRLKHTVHIHTSDRQQAEVLDELLWTYRDGSFVPHEVLDVPGRPVSSPVTIGFEESASGDQDLLINLTDDIPGMAASFPRVAELVTSDEQSRQLSRKRFVQYRELGVELETHNI